MTLSEFRAWLDGFSEAINGAPTAEQWVVILAKFKDVQDPPSSERIVEVPVSDRWGHLPYRFWEGPTCTANLKHKLTTQ